MKTTKWEILLHWFLCIYLFVLFALHPDQPNLVGFKLPIILAKAHVFYWHWKLGSVDSFRGVIINLTIKKKISTFSIWYKKLSFLYQQFSPDFEITAIISRSLSTQIIITLHIISFLSFIRLVGQESKLLWMSSCFESLFILIFHSYTTLGCLCEVSLVYTPSPSSNP